MRSDSIRTFKRSDTTGTSLEDYTQLIVDLLSFGQSLCKQTQSVVEQLCQEIRRVTQGRARLLLPCQDSPEGSLVPFPVSVSFPLQFHKRTYEDWIFAPTQHILGLLHCLYLSLSSWPTSAVHSCILSNCQPS
jgi:hypothetical protein